MTVDQIAGLGSAFTEYLRCFGSFFLTRSTFAHLKTYCNGLLSDLPRKSVEPIALSAGCAVRTLQEFLTHHRWDHAAMRDELQRRIARDHLPPPDQPLGEDGIGTVGLIDETSSPKEGTKTPGVQRQYCGSLGKVDNCIVTVHLAARHEEFLALLDSDLFLPEDSWDQDRDRCKKAHIPDDIIYRPKWKIALEQVHRAIGNGIGFNWLTFDEYYGSKPAFLFELDRMGQHYVGEVPKNFLCFGSLPKYRSLQRPFAAKRVDNIVIWGKPFAGKKWRTIQLQRKTLGPQAWQVKAEQVWLSDHQKPTERTYWLIVARNPDTGETKYFISNAPPRTALTTLIKVAFTRWGIEHVFRIVKSEIGFSHFEGRSYRGLMRHMTLCQLMMLFIAEQTNRMRGEKSAGDDGADRPSTQRGMPIMATPPLQKIGD